MQEFRIIYSFVCKYIPFSVEVSYKIWIYEKWHFKSLNPGLYAIRFYGDVDSGWCIVADGDWMDLCVSDFC